MTGRWWADGQESLANLALVDDSDVVQGVMTAVLGYHGITKAALDPLASRTLMDVQSVRKTLSEVDLEPVAKALGSATRPVLGESADAYGQLLAQDLHEQAVESTERLLRHLTAEGLSWPAAIERVTDFHGVPSSSMGPSTAVIKAATSRPIDRADAADRALMRFASHVGHRENTLTDVSKANRVQFDPSLHPRGDDGEFVDAPNRQMPLTDLEERAARRNRRFKRNTLQAAAVQEAQRQHPVSGGLSELRALVFGEPEVKEEAKVVDLRAAKASKLRKLRGGAAGKKTDQPVDLSEPITSRPDQEWRIGDRRYAAIPRKLAAQIAMDGKAFYAGNLEKHTGPLEFMTHDGMQQFLADLNDVGWAQSHVLIEVNDVPVSDTGGTIDDAVRVAPSAHLVPKGGDVSFEGDPSFINDNAFMVHQDAGDKRAYVPIVQVEVANHDDYGSLHALGELTRGRVYDPETGSYVKKAAEFHEEDVVRDWHGRFADEGGRQEPDSEMADRQARRGRRQARQRRVVQLTPQPKSAANLEALRLVPVEAEDDTGMEADPRKAKTAKLKKLRRATQQSKQERTDKQAARATTAAEAAVKRAAGQMDWPDEQMLHPDDPHEMQRYIEGHMGNVKVAQAALILTDMAKKAKASVNNEDSIFLRFPEGKSTDSDKAMEHARVMLGAFYGAHDEQPEHKHVIVEGMGMKVTDLKDAVPVVQQRYNKDSNMLEFTPTILIRGHAMPAAGFVTADDSSTLDAVHSATATPEVSEPTQHWFSDLALAAGLSADIVNTTPDFLIDEYQVRIVDTEHGH